MAHGKITMTKVLIEARIKMQRESEMEPLIECWSKKKGRTPRTKTRLNEVQPLIVGFYISALLTFGVCSFSMVQSS